MNNLYVCIALILFTHCKRETPDVLCPVITDLKLSSEKSQEHWDTVRPRAVSVSNFHKTISIAQADSDTLVEYFFKIYFFDSLHKASNVDITAYSPEDRTALEALYKELTPEKLDTVITKKKFNGKTVRDTTFRIIPGSLPADDYQILYNKWHHIKAVLVASPNGCKVIWTQKDALEKQHDQQRIETDTVTSSPSARIFLLKISMLWIVYIFHHERWYTFHMSIFQKKKIAPAHVVALFDISSRRVGGSIVVYSSKNRPRVVWHQTVSFSLQSTGNRLWEETLASLETMAKNALAYPLPIDEIFCFVGEPYTRGEFRVVTLEKKNPYKVTKKILDDILEEDFQALGRVIQKKFHAHGVMELLDRKTNWVAVNGHRITDYLGKTVSRVDIGTYWSVTPKEYADEIRHALLKVFKRQHIHCHSSAYAAISTAQTLSPHMSFALLSIGGDSSDLSIVTGEGLCTTLSIPSGARQLLRSVGESFGFSGSREIESLLRMLDRSMLSEAEEKKMSHIINQAGRIWLRAVESAWATAFAIGHVPGICFYRGESNLLSIFKKTLESSSYLKTHASTTWRMIPFENILPGHILFEDGVVDGETSVLALFVGRAHNETY